MGTADQDSRRRRLVDYFSSSRNEHDRMRARSPGLRARSRSVKRIFKSNSRVSPKPSEYETKRHGQLDRGMADCGAAILAAAGRQAFAAMLVPGSKPGTEGQCRDLAQEREWNPRIRSISGQNLPDRAYCYARIASAKPSLGNSP